MLVLATQQVEHRQGLDQLAGIVAVTIVQQICLTLKCVHDANYSADARLVADFVRLVDQIKDTVIGDKDGRGLIEDWLDVADSKANDAARPT